MATVLETSLSPSIGGESSRPEVSVVYTSIDATIAALQHAGALIQRLGGAVSLLVPQIVQQPTPLTSPPVLIDWNERRLRELAQASPVDITVRVFLCRDRDETLLRTLPRRSLVVIGAAHKFWPFGAERRLARRLLRAGHEVVLIEAE